VQPTRTIYNIKAVMTESTSVLMAKAAALALAAIITDRLNLQDINFLSVNTACALPECLRSNQSPG